jgi:hypothetical protein
MVVDYLDPVTLDPVMTPYLDPVALNRIAGRLPRSSERTKASYCNLVNSYS